MKTSDKRWTLTSLIAIILSRLLLIPEEVFIPPAEQEMGFLVMESLASLLGNNSQNASVLRECGGARCAHNMVLFPQCRHQALSIVQQLVLSNGGDDDMGTLLGLMHTAATTSLELKMHILKVNILSLQWNLIHFIITVTSH